MSAVAESRDRVDRRIGELLPDDARTAWEDSRPMTDREALEQIAVIVRSPDSAAIARIKVGDILNKVLGPPKGTPFSRP